MADVRIQVATLKAGDLPRDHIVNTVYFRDLSAGVTSGPNWQKLAEDTRNVFAARAQIPAGHTVQATAYDMDNAKPRPVKAFAGPVPATGASVSESGVREVALCLSYFSERNLPRRRGRIFIGPFTMPQLTLRPSFDTMNAVKGIALGLANVGGIDVDWSLYSPTDVGLKKITNYWVDNEWDTQRSRGRRADGRLAGSSGE